VTFARIEGVDVVVRTRSRVRRWWCRGDQGAMRGGERGVGCSDPAERIVSTATASPVDAGLSNGSSDEAPAERLPGASPDEHGPAWPPLRCAAGPGRPGGVSAGAAS
jgi:hypothetical protein